MAEINQQPVEKPGGELMFDGLLVRAVECFLEDNSIGPSEAPTVNGHLSDIAKIIRGNKKQALSILDHIRVSAEASIKPDEEEDCPTIPGTINGESVMIPISRLGVSLLPPGITPSIKELPNVYDFAGRTTTVYEKSGFTRFSRDNIPYQEKPETVDPYTKI